MAKKKLSQEKIKDMNLKRELDDCFKDLIHCPEPTYKFNIGDKVCKGNLVDVTVSEILENNKIYKIRYSIIHNNYGNPYKEDGLEQYVFWHEIRPINNNSESLIQNEDARLDYHPVSLNSLLLDFYHFGINMEPEYQRGYVWELKDKELLIDSIFKNVDIGKFVLAHKGYVADNMYEIIDGKQRLKAIIEYYENRFPYKGKYYNDLSNRDKSYFLDYPLTKAVIKYGTEKDILRLFLLLNTTGKKMDKSHLATVKEMYTKLS